MAEQKKKDWKAPARESETEEKDVESAVRTQQESEGTKEEKWQTCRSC